MYNPHTVRCKHCGAYSGPFTECASCLQKRLQERTLEQLEKVKQYWLEKKAMQAAFARE